MDQLWGTVFVFIDEGKGGARDGVCATESRGDALSELGFSRAKITDEREDVTGAKLLSEARTKVFHCFCGVYFYWKKLLHGNDFELF